MVIIMVETKSGKVGKKVFENRQDGLKWLNENSSKIRKAQIAEKVQLNELDIGKYFRRKPETTTTQPAPQAPKQGVGLDLGAQHRVPQAGVKLVPGLEFNAIRDSHNMREPKIYAIVGNTVQVHFVNSIGKGEVKNFPKALVQKRFNDKDWMPA